MHIAPRLTTSQRIGLAALVGTVGCATVTAAILGNGVLVAPLAPVLALTLFAVIWVVPVRRTLFTIVFLGLALDTKVDSGMLPRWHSPLAPIGGLLAENLNKTIPIDSLKFSLLGVLLIYVFIVQRRRNEQQRGDVGLRSRNSPVRMAMTVAMLMVAGLTLVGIAGHGDIQMVNLEMQRFVLTVLMAYLLSGALRDDRDYWMLGRIIVAAACCKAALAVWINAMFGVPHEGGYATTHGDSMLFASAVATWAALFFLHPRSRDARFMTLALPLLLAGIAANNRRLAWVEIVTMLVTLYYVSPWSLGKRAVTRVALIAMPLLMLFVAVEWNSNSGIAAPVRILRSIVDGQSDRSTFDRDVENFNLIMTMAASPIIGSGLGQPYKEVIKGDDISMWFAAYRFVPHNSVLWLLAAGGVLGFFSIWSVPSVGLFVAARAFFRPVSAKQQVAAFVAVAAFQSYMIQCWGDMGFSDLKALFILGSALAVTSGLQAAACTPPQSARPATI